MIDTEESYYGYVDPQGNRINLDSQLSVIDGFETSPGRIDEEAGVKGALQPSRVDLREIPMGSVVQFYGMHPDSRYICLLDGVEEERKIKVWLKGRGNGAIGSIDAIVSYSIRTWPNTAEKGVLEIGRNYFMPTFNYGPENPVAQPMFDIKTYDLFFVCLHQGRKEKEINYILTFRAQEQNLTLRFLF